METTITPNKETTLASQAWFIQLLAGKGFTKSSGNTFTNGKATIRVDGSQVTANPGGGKAGYKADFHQADQETVAFMVEQILNLRPFLTDEALAQERRQKERVDQALAGIALTIRDGPDTAGGVQLRRFLWSLYNMHHFVNLWRLTAELDQQRAAWVAEVVHGALAGLVKDADLKRTLQTAGEMDRWDKEQPAGEVMTQLQEAASIVTRLVRQVPPSRAHTVLVSLLTHITESQSELQGTR